MITEASRVCAVVITHYPPPDFLVRLSRVAPQVEALVVVDNTPKPGAELSFEEIRQTGVRARLIPNGENRGLATALNQGLDCAIEMGYDWILTLDQDTTCGDGMVANLIALATVGEPKPAVVGSNHVRPRERLDGAGLFEERPVVITSGSLIDANFCKEIGGFREDFFIDQVDFEFCLRVRSRGRRVVINWNATMQHSIGDPDGHHSPLREYYIARNALVLVWEYFRREPAWCARRLVDLVWDIGVVIVKDRQRVDKVRAIFAGIVDALRRQMGPCRRRWLVAEDRTT